MTYQEAVQKINETPKFTRKHSPADTRAFLDFLGAPDAGMKIIHVAGTNGKGSVCNDLYYILRSAGYRVGLFTSPHLVSIRERIQIDGEMISEEDFLSCFRKVEQTAEKLASVQEPKDKASVYPTFFELLFHIAMLWFGEQKPDYVILETGLGGRLDATNVVREKIMTVITRIGLDHVEYLGDTVEKIAGEKAGILRPGVPVIYLDDPNSAADVIRDRAAKIGANAFPIRKTDYNGELLKNKVVAFSFFYDYHSNSQAPADRVKVQALLPQAALYEAENAALAAAVAGFLQQTEERITTSVIREGLERAVWPGRMEEWMPGVWLDGAHNEDGIRALLRTVAAMPIEQEGRRILLFSVVRDKAYDRMAEMIRGCGLFSFWVAAPLETARGLARQELDTLLKSTSADVHDSENRRDLQIRICGDTKEALKTALELKGPKDQVFIAGSLYLVGEIRGLVTMINFEEELKKFHPSLEIEDAADAIYNQDLSDMADIMIKMAKDNAAVNVNADRTDK